MYEVRWDRVLAAILIALSPLIFLWLKRHIRMAPFDSIPEFGMISHNPELKALVLLGILLLGILLVLKAAAKR